jgi:hypothetical protein
MKIIIMIVNKIRNNFLYECIFMDYNTISEME